MLKTKKAQHQALCSVIEQLHFHHTVTNNVTEQKNTLNKLLDFSEKLSLATKLPEGKDQETAIAMAYSSLLN